MSIRNSMDELLNKYACGVANNEEKAIVRNYLADNMNHLQEMIELMRSIARQELNISAEIDMLSPEKLSKMHKVPHYAKVAESVLQGNSCGHPAFPTMFDVLENIILNKKI